MFYLKSVIYLNSGLDHTINNDEHDDGHQSVISELRMMQTS